jgi:hypothetical protein
MGADSKHPTSLGKPCPKLVTLNDAATCITKLPKTERDAPEWRTAVECLFGAAEGGTLECTRGSACCGRLPGTPNARPILIGRTTVNRRPNRDPSNVRWIRGLSCRSASGPRAD